VLGRNRQRLRFAAATPTRHGITVAHHDTATRGILRRLDLCDAEQVEQLLLRQEDADCERERALSAGGEVEVREAAVGGGRRGTLPELAMAGCSSER